MATNNEREVTRTYRYRADKLHTLADAEQRVHDVGGHYFEAGTKRFFGSRFGATASLPDGSLLFVESTEWRGRLPRQWKVMVCDVDGQVESLERELSNSKAGKRAFDTAYKAAWHGFALGKLVVR